jgi:hypothetical protein
VQGQLREKTLSVVVRTKCAYSSEPIVIEIDSELKYRIVEGGTDPLVFVPHVDFVKLADPSIIDAF